MLGKLKDAEKEIEKFRAEKVLQAAAGLAESAKDVDGVRPGHRAGPGRHGRRRPAQAGPRRARPHPGRTAAVVALSGVANGTPADVLRHQRGRPRARPQGRRPGPHRRQDPRRRRWRQAGRRPGRRPEPGRRSARPSPPSSASSPRRPDDGRGLPAGCRLAIDVGDARIGVASCDPDGILATPVETLRRDEKKGSDLRALASLAAEREAVQVFVNAILLQILHPLIAFQQHP